jgi:murein DD-endopeptidase MepM/ murein hydrolase activator NlpD
MELTQDCNDSNYADHVGSSKHAWDFANGTNFGISAARPGVVTHLKMSSYAGCATSACVDFANYVVVDHGDGTAAVYLHLEGGSLGSGVRCGQPVAQGQPLANAGATGWATGPHLHFQVNETHTGQTPLCECGEDGRECAPHEAAWSSFWSSAEFPSVSVMFDEWAANDCRDRRMILPLSQNLDVRGDRRFVALGRPGQGVYRRPMPKPSVLLGVGGRTIGGANAYR